jgi:hypothetical protein
MTARAPIINPPALQPLTAGEASAGVNAGADTTGPGTTGAGDEIERLARLSTLDYELERKAAAERLNNMRLPILDQLVEAERKKFVVDGDDGGKQDAQPQSEPGMTDPWRVEITVFEKAKGILSKRISLGVDGKPFIDGSACAMGRGSARRVSFGSYQEFADLINNFKSSEAYAPGRLADALPDSVGGRDERQAQRIGGRRHCPHQGLSRV